jgi:hypothetical protein
LHMYFMVLEIKVIRLAAASFF